ncbi:MAG TPA: histidine ammonia-lyase [Gemmatimonadales bacterium]|jgi:histidine ammonia-lyase|nr:histidine ammonia-lyase [Gemmatimonadales bacterium]
MPQPACVLDGQSLAIEDVVRVARDPAARIVVQPEARRALRDSRGLVDQAIRSGHTIYGINTGFGKLANVRIPADQLDQLQANLIRSHAAGVGTPLPPAIVRAVMLLRANVLLRPTSGVRPELVDALVALLNGGVTPLVPEQGSVGASGDLAPLSHIGLALMGEGQVLARDGNAVPAAGALTAAKLNPYRFAPKEGLAFINGTQAQTALLALMVHDANVLWRTAVGAAAMSLEALRGTPAPLDPRIHQVRPHPGQIRAAALMRSLLEDSEIRESHRENDPRVQDAYSLRCAPQVLGAVADAIRFAQDTVMVELNASTDNPLVFENGDVISGGNFHGQPVAQALDVLAMTLTTLQAIAERRVERLVNPDLSQGLPAFLTRDPGLCSGLMMVQITAASLVAESRALAMPASIGSIPTDANQEDFVPMGMAAGYKAGRILVNAQRVVGAELLCAAQGLEFLKPLAPGRGVAALYGRLRGLSPPVLPLTADRSPAPDLERVARAVAQGELDPEAPEIGVLAGR